MSKTYPLAFFALAVLSCNAGEKMLLSTIGFNPIKGTQPVTERSVVHTFDEINVAQSIDAEIVASDEEKVVISAPADLHDYILAEFNGAGLYLKVKPDANIELKDVHVKIYAKDFTKLNASSSADVNIRGTFTQDRVSVEVSSSASVKGHLEANEFSITTNSSASYSGKVWAVNLNAESTSSGDINISGKAKNAVFEASSSGSIDAAKMDIEHLTASVSSSGDVYAGISQSLNAKASSSGRIDVRKTGPLEVRNISESSSGSVTVQ